MIMLKTLLLAGLVALAACSPPDDTTPTTSTTVAEPAVLAAGPAPVQRRVVTLAADPWCPHNCDANSDRQGYMVEVAREALALAQLDVEYTNMSWARALQQADAGQIDAVVGAFTGDAPDFIFPDEAIGYAQTGLFSHADSDWRYRGIASLDEHKLVAINGYSYSPELDAYIDDHQDDPGRVWILSGPSPLARAIELLEQRRSDVLAEDLEVIRWTLDQLDKQEALRQVGQFERLPVYVAFSPANPHSDDLAALLSEGIRKLRRSGRLAAILDRYGMSWSD